LLQLLYSPYLIKWFTINPNPELSSEHPRLATLPLGFQNSNLTRELITIRLKRHSFNLTKAILTN
jgi:hypothetical protein